MEFMKIICNVFPLFFSLAGCTYILCGNEPLLIVSETTSFHFNLITVNALFGGFLYTNYSLLLGLLDNPIIEKIRYTKIIYKRNLHILRGIVSATLSVIASLLLILFPQKNAFLLQVIYCFLQNAEIIYMLFLIYYFLLSIKEMSILVSAIHSNKGSRTPDELEALKKDIIRKRN